MTLDEAIKQGFKDGYNQAFAESTALRKFAEFVSTEVCNDDFNDNADSFAELCCRKLVELGYVEVVEDKYILRGKGGAE